MAALAADLGVRAPSLYRHVESLDVVRNELRLRSVRELGEAVRAAVMGRSGLDGLHALTDAHRAYAQSHPERYLAQTGLPGDEPMREAGRRLGEAGYAVLASLGLSEAELPVATAQLAALVPLPHIYVTANFKETQLTHMRPGQPAEITVDAYPGERVTGTIESFSPASGAQFSLLPPDNATGNFTKIVQRVPVRIALPADAPLVQKLRPGLSVTVSIDTRRAPRAGPAATADAAAAQERGR